MESLSYRETSQQHVLENCAVFNMRVLAVIKGDVWMDGGAGQVTLGLCTGALACADRRIRVFEMVE